uniref:FAD-binding oxidoreductase n=1 Tax=Streptomyces herbicida TaxID=3065675 RepID=UPI0038CD2ED4
MCAPAGRDHGLVRADGPHPGSGPRQPRGRVQPGVTLDQLDHEAAKSGLHHPTRLREPTAGIGGTIATNAGAMHAVRHEDTRHHVLAVKAVLASGEIVRSSGKYVKTSTGYDLAQLLVGSAATLALHRVRRCARSPATRGPAPATGRSPRLPGPAPARPGRAGHVDGALRRSARADRTQSARHQPCRSPLEERTQRVRASWRSSMA